MLLLAILDAVDTTLTAHTGARSVKLKALEASTLLFCFYVLTVYTYNTFLIEKYVVKTSATAVYV